MLGIYIYIPWTISFYISTYNSLTIILLAEENKNYEKYVNF